MAEKWTVNDDAKLMRKIANALKDVPPSAVRRLAPWMISAIDDAGREPLDPRLAQAPWENAQAGAVLGAAQAQTWNPDARAYDHGVQGAALNQGLKKVG